MLFPTTGKMQKIFNTGGIVDLINRIMQSSYNKDGNSKFTQNKEKAGVYFPFLISSLQKYVLESTDNVLRVKSVKVDKVFSLL